MDIGGKLLFYAKERMGTRVITTVKKNFHWIRNGRLVIKEQNADEWYNKRSSINFRKSWEKFQVQQNGELRSLNKCLIGRPYL